VRVVLDEHGFTCFTPRAPPTLRRP
jgi:hypothetical protein